MATRGGTSHDSGAAHGDPRPTFTSLTANDACSAATTRSHCWASRNPPAKATPLTAAIVGLGTSMLRPNCGRKSGGGDLQRGLGHLLEIAARAERPLARAGQHEHGGRRRRR